MILLFLIGLRSIILSSNTAENKWDFSPSLQSALLLVPPSLPSTTDHRFSSCKQYLTMILKKQASRSRRQPGHLLIGKPQVMVRCSKSQRTGRSKGPVSVPRSVLRLTTALANDEIDRCCRNTWLGKPRLMRNKGMLEVRENMNQALRVEWTCNIAIKLLACETF